MGIGQKLNTSGRILAVLLAAFMLACAGPSMAWGPHGTITKVAVQTLQPDDPLLKLLGDAANQLSAYCTMPDNKGNIRKDADGSLYYANDYLLCPAIPRYQRHTCPGVKEAFAPCFHRAVQAIRTESPANAARWIGTLLHFTEDAGAPPHAAPGAGPLHHNMETWIDASKIAIPGYVPHSFGSTEEEALKGYLARMDQLIEFSRIRGERIRPLVAQGKRPEVEVDILDCANECTKVASDLLYTLGHLKEKAAPKGASISGTVRVSSSSDRVKPLPAKVVLLGTNYSTVADASGHYEFHHIPPDAYRVSVLAQGSEEKLQIKLLSGKNRTLNLSLPKGRVAGNLLRDPDFRVFWVRKDGPDCWYQSTGTWDSDLVPVTPGAKYKLIVKWKAGVKGDALVRWSVGKRTTDEAPVSAGDVEHVYAVPAGAAFARVVIHSEKGPSDACSYVSLAPM